MSDLFSFDPTAERAFLFSQHGIRTVYRKSPKTVADFLHRWAPELAAISVEPLLQPFYAALSLSATAGDPAHYRYCQFLQRYLQETIPGTDPFIGNARDVFAEYGLFAIPLPVARVVTGNMNLSAAELQVPAKNFEIIGLWAANVVRQMRKTLEPNVLQIALTLRCSSLTRNTANPYRVQFRGSFLPDFTGYFNTASLLINQKQETDNGNLRQGQEKPA